MNNVFNIRCDVEWEKFLSEIFGDLTSIGDRATQDDNVENLGNTRSMKWRVRNGTKIKIFNKFPR